MWRKESSEPGTGITWNLLASGETPSHLVTGNSRATRPAGVPTPAGDLGDRNTGKVAGPGWWSSGAKDAEKSAGRRRETGRGRCISYMQRPRPIVPVRPKSRPHRHAARGHGHSGRWRGPAKAQRWVVQPEGGDVTDWSPQPGRAALVGRWALPGPVSPPALTAGLARGSPGLSPARRCPPRTQHRV